jgi:hypothetical protein
MKQNDFEKLREFALQFAGLIIEKNIANVGIIQFDDRAHESLGLTSDNAQAQNVIGKLTKKKRSESNYYIGLELAVQRLTHRKGRDNSIPAIVFVTAGRDASPVQLRPVVDKIRNLGADIFAVGLGNVQRTDLATLAPKNTYTCNYNNLTAIAPQLANEIKK